MCALTVSPEALRQLALLCRTTTGCTGCRARWSAPRSLWAPLALLRHGRRRCSWQRRRRRGPRQPVSGAVGGDALEEIGAEALRCGARDAGQRGERLERGGPLLGDPGDGRVGDDHVRCHVAGLLRLAVQCAVPPKSSWVEVYMLCAVFTTRSSTPQRTTPYLGFYLVLIVVDSGLMPNLSAEYTLMFWRALLAHERWHERWHAASRATHLARRRLAATWRVGRSRSL